MPSQLSCQCHWPPQGRVDRDQRRFDDPRGDRLGQRVDLRAQRDFPDDDPSTLEPSARDAALLRLGRAIDADDRGGAQLSTIPEFDLL